MARQYRMSAKEYKRLTGNKVKGRPAKLAGVMTHTEGRHADLLEKLRLIGEVIRWKYEPETIILSRAARCAYTPDFLVEFADGRSEYHEVKGEHMWEDSFVKLKWAASKFPEKVFILCVFKRGHWRRRVVPHD